LTIAFSLILAILLSERVLLPSVAAVAATGTMLALRIPLSLILLRLCAPLGIVLALVVLRTFLTPGAPLLVLTPFGWTITATQEGLIRGILLGSRVLGAVSVVLLLGAVTPAHKIFAALRWFKAPEGWVEIAFLVYRYVFVLLEQVSEVQAAQRARLGHSSIRRSLSSLGILAGTVMARSIDQAFRTHEAMTLRGYQSRYPFGPLARMSPGDWWLAGMAPCLVLAAFLVVGRWPK
jgi:cobalt/nickel transport system permease protein